VSAAATTRLVPYLARVARILIAIVALGLLLLFLQLNFGLFDAQIAQALSLVEKADQKLSDEAVAGISIGSLLLAFGLCVAPLLSRRIHARGFVTSLWRGVISAFVFFLSTALYEYAARANRFYLVLAILGVILVTSVVVEALALAGREEHIVSFRTEITASIASGLLFGIIMKLFQFGIEVAKARIPVHGP